MLTAEQFGELTRLHTVSITAEYKAGLNDHDREHRADLLQAAVDASTEFYRYVQSLTDMTELMRHMEDTYAI